MTFDKFRPIRNVQRKGRQIVKELTTPLKRKTDGPAARPEAPGGFYRQSLYRAESRLYARMHSQYWLRSLEEAQTYCRGVLAGATDYSRNSWPCDVKPTLDGLPRYHSGVLMVPIPVQQMVLLHELAHHLVGVEARHDQKFMAAYVYLLDREMPGTSEKLLAELSTVV